MRRWARLFVVLSVLLLVVSFQFPLALHAQESRSLSKAQEEGLRDAATVFETEFTLVNACSYSLTLYIDGTKSVTVPPGDRGVVFVTPGWHNVRVEQTTDPTHFITDRFDIPLGGFTLTVDEGKPETIEE